MNKTLWKLFKQILNAKTEEDYKRAKKNYDIMKEYYRKEKK